MHALCICSHQYSRAPAIQCNRTRCKTDRIGKHGVGVNGHRLINRLPMKKDITNRYVSSDFPDSDVIKTGNLIADVRIYEYYDTDLVHIKDRFFSPLTNI
jgi:hypothetical protein